MSRDLAVVVGANGLVGSCIAAQLSRRQRVIAVGRGAPREAMQALLAAERLGDEANQAETPLQPLGKPNLGRARGLHAGVEYEDIDLSLDGALQDLIETRRPAAVIFAAGMTDVDACEREVPMAWQLNVRAVEEAALGCREVGARLISLSTDYVFDGSRGPYSESDQPSPRGVYARTKRAGEEAALLLAPDCAVARVAAIFSGRRGAKKTFAVSVAQALREGREVKAFHDQIVSPTLADNAAALCIALLDSEAQGIVHCAGAEAVTRVEFCRTLARKLGVAETLVVPVALADLKLPAPRPLLCGLKVDQIRELGGVPLSLDQALDLFLEEQRASGQLPQAQAQQAQQQQARQHPTAPSESAPPAAPRAPPETTR